MLLNKGLVAIGAFAALPIARLAANNPSEPLPLTRYAFYWVSVVGPLTLGLYLIRRVRPGIVERAAAATALSVWSLAYLAVAIRSAIHPPAMLRMDASIWLGAALVILAILLSRWVFVRNLLPVLALVLMAYPLAEIAVHRFQESGDLAQIDRQAWDIDPRDTPNIYWIVADGYTGPEVMVHDYGYAAEHAFLATLEDHGFDVSDRALAAYPMTHLSMSSTLAMDYLAETGDDISNPHPFYETVQGDNPVVATLRSWGYQFALYPGGLYAATQCTGLEDACLNNVSLDSSDWALLSMTPIASLIEGPRTAQRHADMSSPLSVLKSLEDHPTQAPRFVVAHLLDPHPPYYRSGDDCSVRNVSFNLGAPWEPDEDYVNAVRCLNELLDAMVEHLIEIDPDAVIVIQGDHGPNRGVGFEQGHDVSSWSDEQMRVRFNVLSAMRVPKGCDVPEMMSLVNTFRVVLSCLSGEAIPLLPIRTFTVNSYPGDVWEVGPPGV